MLCGDECECLSCIVGVSSIYRADFLQNLRECLGDSFSHFEAMNSSDNASFVLGSELWEEHFESLLAIVKQYHNVGRRYIGMARMPASRNTF